MGTFGLGKLIIAKLNSLELSDVYYASVTYAITGLDNGFSPGRHQAIILKTAWILLSEP